MCKDRSRFGTKSLWIAAGLFIGAGFATVSGPPDSKLMSLVQGQAPAVITVAGSYLGGFFIGWGARRTIKLTSIISGIALAIIGLLVSWGWDGAAVQSWVN